MMQTRWLESNKSNGIFSRWLGVNLTPVIDLFVERVPLLSRMSRVAALRSKLT